MNKIVESILAEFSKDNGIEKRKEDYRFESLAAYLTIRRHFSRALDLDEVLVGSGGDTGVDAIAIIVNGALITDVDQVQEMLDQNGYIEATFIFVQAERSEHFDGSKIGNIDAGVRDFSRDEPQLTQNENVRDIFEIKTAIYDRASKFQERPACHIYYVTTGKWHAPTDLVARINDSKAAIYATGMFKEVTFVPYGAEDVHRLHTNAKNAISRTLTFREHLQLPAIKGVNLSFLGFVPARDFVQMISDDAGDGIVVAYSTTTCAIGRTTMR